MYSDLYCYNLDDCSVMIQLHCKPSPITPIDFLSIYVGPHKGIYTFHKNKPFEPLLLFCGLVYWGLMPQQQPWSYQGGEMMMKSVFWWRKPEYPEETTDLRQVTDETLHTYGLCPVRGLNLGRSGVKQSELRRDKSGALAHRATAVIL